MTTDNVPAVPESAPPARRGRPAPPARPQGPLPALSGQNFQAMSKHLEEIPWVDDDPTETMLGIILNAQSAAEINALFETSKWKEHIGETIRVHDIRLNESDYDGAFARYLVCDVTILADGERTVMGVGSTLSMAILVNFWKRKEFPYDFTIVVKETRRKNTALNLLPFSAVAGSSEDV